MLKKSDQVGFIHTLVSPCTFYSCRCYFWMTAW